jgi:glucokinase
MKDIAAGVDIGGTNTWIGLIGPSGIVYHRECIKTNDFSNFEDFIGAICLSVNESLKYLKEDYHLRGIGVGAPNGNYYNGCIEFAVNLPWKGIQPLTALMQRHFDLPVILTNDANAAAMGEMIFGAARDMKDFIMITLGTGLGSGIVIDGKVVYGHDGNAGELGHVIVDPGGRICGCGRRGCLETFASATGIRRTVLQLMESSAEKSLLRNLPADQLDSKMIYEAAKLQDIIALQAFDITCSILGKSLANAVAFSSPEAIILFGGLAHATEFLFGPTKKYMEESLLEVYKNKVNILPSQLPESDAALLGAAALVWEQSPDHITK